MKENNKLAKGLLEQNGIDPAKKLEQDRKKIHQQIEKQQARVKRAKWIAIIIFSIWALIFIVGAIVALAIGPELNAMGMKTDVELPLRVIWACLNPILILCVISYLIHRYLLDKKTGSAALLQIQDRLANIEVHLRKLSKED